MGSLLSAIGATFEFFQGEDFESTSIYTLYYPTSSFSYNLDLKAEK